jgi:hypothetical protein
MIPDRSICAKSAQQYANPQRREQTRCQSAAHRQVMGKIITIRFRPPRLPRRLLRDGWWLETPRPRSSVIALPKRNTPTANPKARHLILVHSGK